MPELNIENHKKWVEALESGEFMQGRTQLCRKASQGRFEFCCLGVAEFLAQQEKRPNLTREEFCDRFGHCAGLYSSGRSWLGVDSALPMLESSELYYHTLNDITGKNFREIARYIRIAILKEDVSEPDLSEAEVMSPV